MYKKYQYNTETGTKALEIALKICKSKKVIIPTYTCEDVLTAVLNAGCKPIIVDCNKNLQIDVASVLKVVSEADTIIIPHMFGIKNQVSPFKNFNLKIIEDISQCHGLPGLGDFADVVVTSLNKSKWLDKNGGGYIWTDKKLQEGYYLSTDKMSDWGIEVKYNNRLIKSKELLNAGVDLIGKDIPNSWLRGMYFTGTPTRRPYIPLHEIYGKFDCPIVDSYSNKIDWISIFN
tara:strand:+ start:1319 stop:2014 length:696 start_codon:yes stop_codon:yes gene_type:complete